jgi:hypothetical protein
VVFGTGEYAPGTSRGARLLAHELTHVVQQDAMPQSHLIQRDGMGDLHLAEACPDLIDKIRATPAFKALNVDSRRLTEEIIAEIRKRSLADQYHFLSLLKLLFDTPVKPPATISVETQASTTTAATAEKARLTKPVEAKNVTLEEKASADPKRSWVAIPGKFGGGTYYVDRTSPSNIVVKADILLTPKGTGTKKDVDAIKSMEDAIEKAASTRGYLVDIRLLTQRRRTHSKWTWILRSGRSQRTGRAAIQSASRTNCITCSRSSSIVTTTHPTRGTSRWKSPTACIGFGKN